MPARLRPAAADAPVRPLQTLSLLSAAHAANHAIVLLMPLVYLQIIGEMHVDAAAIAILTAAGNFVAGLFQLAYSGLTRRVSRRSILTVGGIVMGLGMAAQGLTNSFGAFSVANIVTKVGGSPQHPVGNALLAEQFPARRRGFAISAHIAGGNIGTIAVPLIGTWLIAGIGWHWTVVLLGLPAILVALAIGLLVTESGSDREAARQHGSVVAAFGRVFRDRDLVILFLASVVAAAGRGLGVLTLFVPLYLSEVLHVDATTIGWMYTLLLLGSVPAPLVAGWVSDRIGRRPVLVVAYLAGATALVLFVLAGSDQSLIWLAILLMSAFVYIESPQLQAILADIAPPAIRDAAFSSYSTLAFVVGSLWTALFGAVLGGLGDVAGLPIIFWIMAGSFVAASVAVLPIRTRPRDEGAG
ncbi:MAG TPA: MFS transporter [Candidatus Limnocylindrales bacterium]|nr:MFS transporter [Candidatus Limnocylindrales bacterium]